MTSRLILCEDLVSTGPETPPVSAAMAASYITMCKTIQLTAPFFVCSSEAYTHILCPHTHTHTHTHTLIPSTLPSNQLRGHNFWRALLSGPVERNVLLWGAEGPLEAGGPRAESRSLLPLLLTGPRPLGPLHSSNSGYTASGPPSQSHDAYQI